LRYALAAGALFLLTSAPAQADTIVGALALNASGVSTTNPNLSTSGVELISTGTVVLSQGTGYFETVPLLTAFPGTTFAPDTPLDFTFSITGFGSFTTDEATKITRNSTTLDYYLLGTFDAPGFDSSPMSVRVTYAYGPGGTLVGAFQINAPPVPLVPEPSSIAMAGIGLAALGLVRTLRKRTV